MDKSKENADKTLIRTLEDVQKEFPDLILPNMGIIDNEKNVEINGKDYLKNNNDTKEE